MIAKYEAGSSYNVAQVYAMQGQRDKAFTWLDKAVGYHDGGLTTILIDPLVDSLSDDPRWVPFLRTIGRAPEQVGAVQFHVTVPAP